jgi:hypothetical protein
VIVRVFEAGRGSKVAFVGGPTGKATLRSDGIGSAKISSTWLREATCAGQASGARLCCLMDLNLTNLDTES